MVGVLFRIKFIVCPPDIYVHSIKWPNFWKAESKSEKIAIFSSLFLKGLIKIKCNSFKTVTEFKDWSCCCINISFQNNVIQKLFIVEEICRKKNLHKFIENCMKSCSFYGVNTYLRWKCLSFYLETNGKLF